MKKVVSIIASTLIAVSAMGVEISGLSTAEMSQWNATDVISVNYKDFSAYTSSNVTATLTNVLGIAAGTSLELVAFVLDKAWVTPTHTNIWTNSISLTVTDAGATNSILAATEIAAESTEVWLKLPFVQTTLNYVASIAGTNNIVVTSGSTAVMTMPAGNKYYTAANGVNITLTPGGDGVAFKRSLDTAGAFRLFVRRHKSND